MITKSVFAAFLCICLFSCSKNNTTLAPSIANDSSPTFSFIADGIKYEMNGSLTLNNSTGSICALEDQTTDNKAYFEIRALSNNGKGGSISFLIPTSEFLSFKTINFGSNGNADGAQMHFSESNPGYYKGWGSTSDFNVVISRVSNGTVDGTFSGTATSGSNNTITTISKGEFRNVEINY